MFGYWLLYFLSAIPAFIGIKERNTFPPAWIAAGLLFILAIGFREEVGGDWPSYLRQYYSVVGVFFSELKGSDPGYLLLNWIMARWEWQIYGVNTVCGAIFILGLFIYCRQLPAPWLGLAVAVPYLIIVVAMGYTRQSVALGSFFIALADIERGHFLRYIAWIALGVTFHKSAVLLAPLGIFIYRRGWFWRSLAIVATAYGLWVVFLEEEQEELWYYYVDRQMQSEGARVRVLMNLVPSVLLLLYAKKWRKLFPAFEIWFWLSIAALIGVALVDFATTAVDRVSLYFTPLQIAVLARLPVLARSQLSPQLMRFGILTGYALVLFVWLNYASHAPSWLPYRNLLLE